MDLTNRKNRRKSSMDLSTMVYGKVPPQSKECEEAVLGALLLEKECYDTASTILKPECFYVDAHQRIYKAIQDVANKSQPIDQLTIKEQLLASEELDMIGGPYYLTKLTQNVVSGANIERHCQIIYEKFLKREQIRICGEGISDAYEDNTDAFDLLDSLQASVNDLATSSSNSDVTPITNILIERFKRLEELRHRDDHLTGVPSGFDPIDRLTAGWQQTDLIIIAARPSVGKTAFALNLARNAARHKTKPTPVAIFSLEMSGGQVTDRLMSAESGIDLDLIVKAKLDDTQMQSLYENGIVRIAQYKIFVDDTPAMNIYELKTKCRKLKKNEGIGLIILDYLQLMSGMDGKIVARNTNREQEISNISRNLKGLAKELKIPVIALSQLSRDLEKQKRDPQLSDLRESGAIEQDADMVCFLTRPDYQQGDADTSIQSFGDLHIKKHRNGSLAKIPLRTALNVQRWMSNEEYDIYERNLRYGNLKPLKVVNGDYQTEEDPF